MIKHRYFNNNRGPIKENEIKAFQKALHICDTEKDVNEIILLIHTKSNTGYIERIFDTRNVKKLFNGVKITQNYPPVRIETVRTFNDQYQSKYVLVCFGLRSEEIYKYEDFESVIGIVAHQWVEPDVQNWAKTYGAIDIDTNEEIEKTEKPDIIVQNALKDLTSSINMSTGIIHSDDDERCKTYIRALKKYNYELNSQQVFSYLTAELKWESDDANDVIKLIDKVNSGGYFQGGAKTGLKFYIKRWQAE
ncbi:hypothetical protein N9954_07920 [Maribacter sp.]|nr:hypothetical protein [Maribacter sp.]